LKDRLAWLALAALVVGGVLVFWVFDALPFQDLPAHAGLIALRHRLAASPFEQRYYVLAPQLGPYSLFRGLGEALIVPLGPVGAVRALATLPVLATPAAVLWSRRTLHGDRSPAAGGYAVALTFGFMTILGFASYLLGVAALVALLTAWLEVLAAADRGATDVRWEVGVAVGAPALLLVHGDAFVVFLGLAGVTAIAAGRRAARLVRLRALVPAFVFAAWVATASWSHGAAGVPPGSAPLPRASFAPHFQGLVDKLSLLVTPTLLTRTGIDAAVAVLLWIVIGASAFATARALPGPGRDEGATHARALLAATAVTGLAFLALPHEIGWFGFVDGRLVPIVLLLALLAVRVEALGAGALRASFQRGGAIAALVMVALAFAASAAFQREATGWREVLAAVPAEARLLNLPIDPNSRWFTAHPFVHYDKLVMTDRPVVVSDVWFHQGSGLYPTSENPALRLPEDYRESDLRTLDWASYRLADWDYALVRTSLGAPQPAIPQSLASRVRMVAHRGGWWLFRTASE
jgi:hypothetical protein